MLSDVRDRAAILAAQAQALDEAKHQQQNPRRYADFGVARHDADEGRGQTHAAQRDEEGVLAPHEVADAAEHEGSERTDQEPGGEGPDRLDERAAGGARCEKLDRQERGLTSENVEVVPLDNVPDGSGDDDTAKFLDGQRRSSHNSLGSEVVIVRAALRADRRRGSARPARPFLEEALSVGGAGGRWVGLMRHRGGASYAPGVSDGHTV